MKVLVINAGSSSLKYQLFSLKSRALLAIGLCERIGLPGSQLKHNPVGQEKYVKEIAMPDHKSAVNLVLEALLDAEHGVMKAMDEIKAVGHRVVNCGACFAESVLISDEVKQSIVDCYDLSPLHNPPNMTGIEACEEALPGVPMVAVFDTAFHQTMPEKAYMYGLPYEYYEQYNIRRYGAHGTSHRYVAERAAEFLKLDPKNSRIISLHLGNGSSITAVKNGISVDTSMGMTPLSGPLMGTRCGDIDPAIVPFMMDRIGLSIAEVDDVMNKKSGVAGVSGVSSDFRDLAAAAEEGNKRAQLALDLFAYHCKKYIGAYMAAMGGVDAIVFTAGIGENDDWVRQAICSEMEDLGIVFDAEKNRGTRGKEIVLSKPESKVLVAVIPTNEELMIARDTARIAGI